MDKTKEHLDLEIAYDDLYDKLTTAYNQRDKAEDKVCDLQREVEDLKKQLNFNKKSKK